MISGNLAFRTNLAVIAAILFWLIEVYTSLPHEGVFKSAFETSKGAIYIYIFLEYHRPPWGGDTNPWYCQKATLGKF